MSDLLIDLHVWKICILSGVLCYFSTVFVCMNSYVVFSWIMFLTADMYVWNLNARHCALCINSVIDDRHTSKNRQPSKISRFIDSDFQTPLKLSLKEGVTFQITNLIIHNHWSHVYFVCVKSEICLNLLKCFGILVDPVIIWYNNEMCM